MPNNIQIVRAKGNIRRNPKNRKRINIKDRNWVDDDDDDDDTDDDDNDAN
jgi:hypothetical protein